MRDPERIEPMLSLIREVWTKAPDLRLTQLIMNALNANYDPYYIEDDDLEKALTKYNKLIKVVGRG
jgi:uncharacterized protein YihD (DUF1040 family)